MNSLKKLYVFLFCFVLAFVCLGDDILIGPGVTTLNGIDGEVQLIGDGITVTPNSSSHSLTLSTTVEPVTVNELSGDLTITVGGYLDIVTDPQDKSIFITTAFDENKYVPYSLDVNNEYSAVVIGDSDNPNNYKLGEHSFVNGTGCIAEGDYSHAEGLRSYALAPYSHAEGVDTVTHIVATNSHAEGKSAWVYGQFSHGEGYYTIAAAHYGAHVEGNQSKVFGNFSHAEGLKSIASNEYSHAEGVYATATNDNSFVWSGIGDDDNRYYSHGYGSFNINPSNGLSGFWIGESNLTDHILAFAGGGTEQHYIPYTKDDDENYTSMTIGNRREADVGEYSSAQGDIITASGEFSHGEGFEVVAEGQYSHAEGSGTTASGEASHAEGYGTTASGATSHSEGHATTARGSYSHAEGEDVYVNGMGAHAEGNSTISDGRNSHTEGYLTCAIWNDSFTPVDAELYYEAPFGFANHAEGKETTVAGSFSHAEGVGSLENSQVAISGEAESLTYTYDSDASHIPAAGTIILYNDEIIARIESVDTTEHVITLDKSLSDEAIDEETYKIYRGIAYAQYAHSEGTNTVAGGIASHAEGRQTKTTGEYSHTEGRGTVTVGQASHAEGQGTKAIGNYSHSEGNNTTANGTHSHSEGNNTIAYSNYSHAEGNNTKAFNTYSHAEGNNTTASGYASHSEGGTTVANALNTHAEGLKTYALGTYSHSEGQGSEKNSVVYITGPANSKTYTYTYTVNSGAIVPQPYMVIKYTNNVETNYAMIKSIDIVEPEDGDPYTTMTLDKTLSSTTAIDNETYRVCRGVAYGDTAHVEGWENTAGGIYSHAEGHLTTTYGPNSHAEGLNTLASGSYSHAEGRDTEATAYGAHAEGHYAYATNDFSYVWNGAQNSASAHNEKYYSHGNGTFNIRPIEGIDGFWIDNTNLSGHITIEASAIHNAVEQYGTILTQDDPTLVSFDNSNKQYFSKTDDIEGTNSISIPSANQNSFGKLTICIDEAPSVDFRYDFISTNIVFSDSTKPWMTTDSDGVWKFEFTSIPGTKKWYCDTPEMYVIDSFTYDSEYVNVDDLYRPAQYDPLNMSIKRAITKAIPENYNNLRVLNIPSQINGEDVKVIGKYNEYAIVDSDEDKEKIKRVIIPDTVEHIVKYSFDGFGGMESIVFGNSVAYIGGRAFNNCESLKSVEFPDSLIDLNHAVDPHGYSDDDGYAFGYCSSLTNVTFGNGITVIPRATFYVCENLNTINFSSTITNIEENAFYGTGFIDLTIPSTITKIGKYAFGYNQQLTNVILNANITNLEEHTFRYCMNLKSITLPNSLVTIGTNAFWRCGLENIVIPDNVETIEKSAFEENTALTEITFGKKVNSIEQDAFKNCNAITTVKCKWNGSESYGHATARINQLLTESGYDVTRIQNWEEIY